jgi:ribonuclease HI/probable phosphoglycerate mutase
MGIGYQLSGEESRVLVRVGVINMGPGTNNEAEYQALLAGLRHALRLGFFNIRVRSDSMLVVKQMQGQWKVRVGRIRYLHAEAQVLAHLFTSFSIEHVRREENTAADSLSHQDTFAEPTLPPLPRHRALHSWQAAAIRVWYTSGRCYSSAVLGRIFGITPQAVDQVTAGEAYRDADFVPAQVAAEASCPA